MQKVEILCLNLSIKEDIPHRLRNRFFARNNSLKTSRGKMGLQSQRERFLIKNALKCIQTVVIMTKQQTHEIGLIALVAV